MRAFNRTLQTAWAYATAWTGNAQRTAAIWPPWWHRDYNDRVHALERRALRAGTLKACRDRLDRDTSSV